MTLNTSMLPLWGFTLFDVSGWQALLREPSAILVVALVGPDVIGAFLQFCWGRFARAYAIGVLSAWRGRGVARTIMTVGLHHAYEREVACIEGVLVFENPFTPLGLYYQVGFRPVNQLSLFTRTIAAETFL
jgi:ribosomal protein S18 acetylase RimI-like enzyme